MNDDRAAGSEKTPIFRLMAAIAVPPMDLIATLKVSGAELKTMTPVDDPVRQIQAPELVEDAVQVEPMVGRSRRARRRAGLPEDDELRRADPELFELVEESGTTAEDTGQARSS